jgi:hypothetical protein
MVSNRLPVIDLSVALDHSQVHEFSDIAAQMPVIGVAEVTREVTSTGPTQ